MFTASFGAITNPVGSILSGVFAEYLGRKVSIQISTVPFIIGWLLIAASTNIWTLYVGRLITGIAGGIAVFFFCFYFFSVNRTKFVTRKCFSGMSSACYTYVSEISTPKYRGILQAVGPASASFGILFTYVMGWCFKWNLVSLICTSFGVFTLISMMFVPESPAKLLKSGKDEACLESLKWFRHDVTEAQLEYKALKENNESSLESGGLKQQYLNSATIKPFFVLVVLFLLQVLAGVYSILFYAVNFFQEANIVVDEHLSSILLGGVRFLMSIVGAVLISRFSRKSMLLLSTVGMAVSLLLAVVYYKYYEYFKEEIRIFPSFPLICILFYVMFSMIGMLPIPWILVGELFPLRVRSIMSGVVICMAQCFVFICVKIYPDSILYLNFSGTLLVFLIATVLTILLCKFYLPETKNKTLEEIEKFFSTKQVNFS